VLNYIRKYKKKKKEYQPYKNKKPPTWWLRAIL
jgi:hypothetical protein